MTSNCAALFIHCFLVYLKFCFYRLHSAQAVNRIFQVAITMRCHFFHLSVSSLVHLDNSTPRYNLKGDLNPTVMVG